MELRSNDESKQVEAVRHIKLEIAELRILEILTLTISSEYHLPYDDAFKYRSLKENFIKFYNKLAAKCQYPLL